MFDEWTHAAFAAGDTTRYCVREEYGIGRVTIIADNISEDYADVIANALNRYRESAIIAARREYGSNEIEIDDDAGISESELGTFVQAWVWVSNVDMGLNDEEDDDA